MNRNQRGFAVLAVVVGLVMLAVGVLVLSQQSSSISAEASAVEDRLVLDQLLASAEAHAQWELQDKGCANYAPLSQSAGNGSYNASFDVLEGSPVSVSLTSTLPNGLTATRTLTETVSYAEPNLEIFEITKTAYLDEGDVTKNQGNHNDVHIGLKAGTNKRAVVEADISSLPSTLVIDEAILHLDYMAEGIAGAVVSVHRVTKAWHEANVSWQHSTNSTDWSNPGGDYESVPVGTFTVPATASGPQEINVTEAVRDWHTGAAPNYGLILLIESPSGDGETKFFTEDKAANSMTLEVSTRCECHESCAVDNVVSCDAEFRANTESGSFAHNVGKTLEGVTTVPGNINLMGITFPEDGGTVVAYQTKLEAFDRTGTSIGTCTTGVSKDITGLSYVLNGPHAEKLVVVLDDATTQLAYIGVDCASTDLVVADSTISQPQGITYLAMPNGHMYEHHYVLTDANGNLEFVDPNGSAVGTAPVSLPATSVRGVAQIYNKDKLLLLANGSNEVYKVGFGGIVEDRYDYLGFGSTAPGGMAVDMDTCEHILASDPANEITRASYQGLTIQPVSHWKLDETSGSTALDSVGSMHGSLGAGGTWDPTGGAVQGAVTINTPTQGITIPHHISLDMEESFTVAGWIFTTGVSGYQPILGMELATNQHNYWLGIHDLQPTVMAYDGTDHQFSALEPIVPGNWYHLVGVYDSELQQVRIYVNGSLATSQSLGGPLQPTPGVLYLGRGVSTHADGFVDDVYLFNKAIPEQDISLLFAESPPGIQGPYTIPMAAEGAMARAAGAPESICMGDSYADSFETWYDWSGSTGSLSWGGNWEDLGEGSGIGSQLSGEVKKVKLDGKYWAQINNGNHGLQRSVDLGSFSSATISFKYFRTELDLNDSVQIGIGDGSGFTELGTITEIGTGSADSPQFFSANVSDRLSSDAYVQFLNKSTMNAAEGITIDDFLISGCY